MAMIQKSRIPINILSRRRALLILAKNVADTRGIGSDERGTGSENKNDGNDNYGLYGLFTLLLTPSDCNPSTSTMYESRKYGHCLPKNDVVSGFDSLPNIPTGIFRCTVGEKLGTGAGKCCYYKCPEYFSYHHMTFYDMHLHLRPCRKPSVKTGRKP